MTHSLLSHPSKPIGTRFSIGISFQSARRRKANAAAQGSRIFTAGPSCTPSFGLQQERPKTNSVNAAIVSGVSATIRLSNVLYDQDSPSARRIVVVK